MLMASSTCQVEAKHAVFLSLQDPVTKCDSIHLGMEGREDQVQ